MRTYLLAAMAAAVLCAAGVSGGLAQSSNDSKNRWMTVKNLSKYTAANIYIIPSPERAPSSDDCCWSRDLLEGHEIREKQPYYVNFDDGSSVCGFDIRVVSSEIRTADKERKFKEWNFDRINVCRENTIYLTNVLGKSSDDGENRWITVENKSDFKVLFIHIKPSSRDPNRSSGWSRDLLQEDSLPRRSSLDVHFDDGGGECTFDVWFKGAEQRKEWKFHRFNVCAKSKITLK